MKHHYSIFLAIWILAASSLYGQDRDELERRHGFKDIKLGSEINAYKGLIMVGDKVEEGVPGAKTYTSKPGHYTNIGGIEITGLSVNVYRNQIYSISVTVLKKPELLKALKKAFGKPLQILGSTSYEWKTESLVMVYRSHSNEEVELFYNSYTMREKMKKDREKEIQEIADDF